MLYSPPKHTIEAAAGVTSVYVVRSDPAWNRDRVAREVAEFFGGDESLHPVSRYHRGESRFDLDAEYVVGSETVTARTYLKGRATEFRLRRLSTLDRSRVMEWLQIRPGEAPRNIPIAMNYCTRLGAVEVENLDIPWLASDGELSEITMSALYDCSTDNQRGAGQDLITEIGVAVWQLSKPLDYSEKKA